MKDVELSTALPSSSFPLKVSLLRRGFARSDGVEAFDLLIMMMMMMMMDDATMDDATMMMLVMR